MDAKLLEILVCPACKGPLLSRPESATLICRPCRLAYPIREDIPVMMVDEATAIAPDVEL
jgi:uncharacterized protein YbaR (Trm112 family)